MIWEIELMWIKTRLWIRELFSVINVSAGEYIGGKCTHPPTHTRTEASKFGNLSWEIELSWIKTNCLAGAKR